MNVFNKLSIKSKFAVLFILLCFSIFIFGKISISISETSKFKLKEVYLQSQDVLILQESIISPLYKLREETQSLVMAPNKKLRVEIQERINLLVKSIEKSFYNYNFKENINNMNIYEKIPVFASLFRCPLREAT